MKIYPSIIGIFLLFLTSSATAQMSYSSASLSMNRANGIVSADQVVVEEYMNYHRHEIPRPQGKSEIALSIDHLPIDDKHVVVQVGIATKKLLDYSNIPPINVALVIDRSGSMQSDNKLEKVKRALAKFIKGLRPKDYISIVTYSETANVLISSTPVGQIPNLKSIINSIAAGGSTNLHEGLMLGYEEVKKQFNPDHTNKVILLTDGIANQGVVEPEQIVKNSSFYNQAGLQLATIGVGNDLNHSLLQQLAKQGKGANHFVGNAEEDIVKVFIDELEGLLSPIAKQVHFTLDYPQSLKLIQFYGYNPTYRAQQITLPLKNINSGLTQIFVMVCEVEDPKKAIPITAKLNYYSYANKAPQEIDQHYKIKLKDSSTEKGDVLKNYHIAQMANALKEMGGKVSSGHHQDAGLLVEAALKKVDAAFPHLRDADLLRVRDILSKHQRQLTQFNYSKRK